MKNKKPESFLGWLEDILGKIFKPNIPSFKNNEVPSIEKLTALLKHEPKYFRYNSKTIQPLLIKFFYDIFTMVKPLQADLKNFSRSKQIRNIVVEYFLTEKMRTFSAEISPSERTALKIFNFNNIEEAKQIIQKETQAIVIYLQDPALMHTINRAYTNLCAFADLVNFDFLGLLQVCDPLFSGENKLLRFRPVAAKNMVQHIDNFLLQSVPLFDSQVDWDQTFDILNSYHQYDFISRSTWEAFLSSLQEMLSSYILQAIICITYNKSNMIFKRALPSFDIVTPYIAELLTRGNSLIEKLEKKQQFKDIEKIEKALFGPNFGKTILTNYTYQRSQELFGSSSESFEFTASLNNLVHFANMYIDTSIKELIDRFILSGKWGNNMYYKNCSFAIEHIIQNRADILQFDQSLEMSSLPIQQIKVYIAKGVNTLSLHRLVLEINDKAKTYIEQAVQDYSIIAHSLWNYATDYQKTPYSEILLNWDEVAHSFKKDLLAYLTEAYNKISQFIELLHIYTPIKAKQEL